MTEILSPAGNLEKLKTALLYGADAIYLASQKYSLRAGADNFNFDEIKEAVRLCHSKNRKVYVTLNAYLYDGDIDGFVEHIYYLDQLGIDAVICADLGVVHLVKKHTQIPIHLSTQAFVLNTYHASLWKELGVKRIVLGRELSLQQAARIKQKTGIEVELFIHGALCMSYSGHCTISNFTAGRDSNRGGCIQSCRHLYHLEGQSGSANTTQSFLSSKDLMGIQALQDFIKTGINCAKIEGRMKSELYVASTTRAYSQFRNELKQKKSIDWEYWKEELQKLPFRGYTSGSLLQKADSSSVYNAITKNKGEQYEMLGKVLFYDKDKKRCFLYTKNQIRKRIGIEILTPTNNLVLVVENLLDYEGNLILYAQSNRVVSFDCAYELETGWIVRVNRTQFPKKSFKEYSLQPELEKFIL